MSFRVTAQSIHGIVGYHDVDAGKILVNRAEVTDDRADQIGFATQETCFYDDITVEANIAYFGSLYGVPRQTLWQRAKQLLRITGLSETPQMKAGHLSGGMKRRFDLVLSLLHNPSVLILDEPATGLDPKLKRTIWTTIQRINDLGVTIIVSNHLLNDLETICDEISLLHRGTIVSSASPRRLRDPFSHDYQLRIETRSGDYNELFTALQNTGLAVENIGQQKNHAVATINDPGRTIRAVSHALNETGQDIVDISIEKPGLERLLEKVG